MKTAAYGFAFVLGILACQSTDSKKKTPKEPADETADLNPPLEEDLDEGNLGRDESLPTPMFEDVQIGVIEAECFPCHTQSGGNSGGVNLETYEMVYKHRAKIYDSTLTKKTMPPQSTMSQEQKDLLKAWLDGGAPEVPGEIVED